MKQAPAESVKLNHWLTAGLRREVQKKVWQPPPNFKEAETAIMTGRAAEEKPVGLASMQPSGSQKRPGRQEAWGGRPQREQTAGMLNYHTSVHDMSTLLTTAQRLTDPVQSRVRLAVPSSGSAWSVGPHWLFRNTRPHGTVVFFSPIWHFSPQKTCYECSVAHSY